MKRAEQTTKKSVLNEAAPARVSSAGKRHVDTRISIQSGHWLQRRMWLRMWWMQMWLLGVSLLRRVARLGLCIGGGHSTAVI
jgi:hypothetical protein